MGWSGTFRRDFVWLGGGGGAPLDCASWRRRRRVYALALGVAVELGVPYARLAWETSVTFHAPSTTWGLRQLGGTAHTRRLHPHIEGTPIRVARESLVARWTWIASWLASNGCGSGQRVAFEARTRVRQRRLRNLGRSLGLDVLCPRSGGDADGAGRWGSCWQAESVQQGRRKMSDGGDGTRTRDGSALGGAGPRSASRGRERLREYRKERALSITRAHRPPDSLHALAKDVPLINCRSLQSDRTRPQSMSAPQKRTLRRWASGLVGRRLCSATSLRIPGSRPPQNLAPWVVVSACLTNWRQDALGRDLLHDDGRPPSVHPRFRFPHYSIQGRIVVHTKLCNPRMSREFQLHATDEGDELRSVRFAARAMLYDSTRRPIAGAE